MVWLRMKIFRVKSFLLKGLSYLNSCLIKQIKSTFVFLNAQFSIGINFELEICRLFYDYDCDLVMDGYQSWLLNYVLAWKVKQYNREILCE